MNQIVHCDWLHEQARWSYFAHLRLATVSHKKNFRERQIINPLLTKLFQSRWLDIGLIFFLQVYGPQLLLGPKTCKKRTGPKSSHLDRKSLVNDPYAFDRSSE